MPPKKTSRNWNDVQMAIAAVAMTFTLALWNLFAGPDRAEAARKAVEQPQTVPVPTETPAVALNPAPMPIVKIIFGNGAAPQNPSSPSQPGKPKPNRDDGGGGGGGGGASTRSS